LEDDKAADVAGGMAEQQAAKLARDRWAAMSAATAVAVVIWGLVGGSAQ